MSSTKKTTAKKTTAKAKANGNKGTGYKGHRPGSAKEKLHSVYQAVRSSFLHRYRRVK